MKIEIEFEEVESLKKSIEKQKAEIESLENELKSLDNKQLKQDSTDLAKQMFDNVLLKVFEKLGFDKRTSILDNISFRELEHYNGTNWWQHQDLKVTIGATITNEFKRAFLNMGIKTKQC